MTLVPAWLVRLAGGTSRHHRSLAREAQAEESRLLRAHLHEDEARFETTMRSRDAASTVLLGETEGGLSYRLPIETFRGASTWMTASTGAGKTRLAAHLVTEFVRASLRGVPVSVLCLDMKGGEDSLADLVLRSLADLSTHTTNEGRDRLARQLTTLAFFEGPFLVPWNILAPDTAIDPLTQGAAVAEILEAVVGRGFGARQESSLALTLAAAIDAGRNLVELRHALEDRATLAALLAQATLPEVRRFAGRIARESQASIDGLGSRIDLLFRSRSAKAMLAGRTNLDLSTCFEPGSVTVINAGSAPIGAEGPAAALGAITLAYLTHAIFDSRRRVRGFTVLVTDEIQAAALTPSNVHCLERILTLGRSFGVGLVSCHQSAAQLPSEIRTILGTNIALRVIGTSGAADAALAAEYLPRTGRVPRPRLPGSPPPERPEYLSAAEEERFRVAELGRLPRGAFLVADRREAFQPRIVRTPRFDPPSWRAIDPALAQAVQQGRAGRPREVLFQDVRALEERLLAEDATPDASSGPDPVASAATVPSRSRRGGVTVPRPSRARARPAEIPEFPDLVSDRRAPRRRGLP